jgi:Rod binding domain-containing protein
MTNALAPLLSNAARGAGVVPTRMMPAPNGTPALSAELTGTAKDKARKASQAFEAMFREQTLDRVFASSEAEGPLGDNGPGSGVYRSMLVKEYAGSIVKSGGVGIADQVYREMLKLQEGGHAARR